MAFELAGGEPADAHRASRTEHNPAAQTPDHNSRTQPDQPVSSVAPRDFDHVVAAATSHSSIATAQTAAVFGMLGGIVPDLQTGFQPSAEQMDERGAPLAGEPNAEMRKSASLESAHMLAFEQLANNETAARSSLGLEFSLRGALNATPLLMILALERIAANNSRRASRDERCPTALSLRRAAKE
jgi:hypothetical protein